MPRATVRAAITTYLQSAAQTVPGLSVLGAVFAHPPKWTDEQNFFATSWSGQNAGAAVYVYLEEQSEERIRLIGSALGGKQRTYKVKLLCFFRAVGKAEDADAGNDSFLDALVLAIQENRQPGGSSVVFQWGEGDTVGGVDINVSAGMPRPINARLLQVYSTVEVLAIEMDA